MSTATLEKNLVKEPESEVRIRFVDCDPFGHLNNARYLDYFISTREEHLREHYDLDIHGPEHRENSWVVRNSAITYQIPAACNARTFIRTRLLKATRSSLIMEAVMLDEQKQRIHAAAWLEFRHLSLKTGRPARHTETMMELFTDLELDVDFSFDSPRDRLTEIKRESTNP